jgi:hypothetical protein
LDLVRKMFHNASSLKPLGQRTIQWTFLSSLDSVWFVVSEKKAFEHFPTFYN